VVSFYPSLVFVHGGGAKASSDVQRKLTAILCADVTGYSRLMGADEEAKIDALLIGGRP